jgi:starch synthase (maltosyl-transferring)
MACVLDHIVIDDIRPRTTTGAWPAKAVVGEPVWVSADIYKDGHDALGAEVRYRPRPEAKRAREAVSAWRQSPMWEVGNDRWVGVALPDAPGSWEIVVEAWTAARAVADLEPLVAEGEREDRTASAPMPLWVDRPRALTGAWYELFPRSFGGFKGVEAELDRLAEQGFDVLYLPPIHPIGRTARKGPDNTLQAGPDDPGSPWAIGGPEGGHTAVHPDLGTLDDFDHLVAAAAERGIEVALDYALQCSPDHPWLAEHPEWFWRRRDGSIAYAENPPKKYQDIYPLNFWPPSEEDRLALWEACRGILEFWISHGVKIFRVDNPHTKPIAFWSWLVERLHADHPDVVLLAEAFTRPKVMAKLAEVGFSQSYTYFTWRNTAEELRAYLEELASPPLADFMRPNLWTNTPDILAGPLRRGPISAFRMRALLAATLGPSWGMYSGFELGENEPASEENEEYAHSEKYELRRRDFDDPGSIGPWIGQLNAIRRAHPALGWLRTLRFHWSNNPAILAYSKTEPLRTAGGDAPPGDPVLVVVNLDPFATQEATLSLDLAALGFGASQPLDVHDELTGQDFHWTGPHPYVRLDPHQQPGHVLAVGARP